MHLSVCVCVCVCHFMFREREGEGFFPPHALLRKIQFEILRRQPSSWQHAKTVLPRDIKDRK